MKRWIVVGVCVTALLGVVGCEQMAELFGGTTKEPINISGSWSGSGKYDYGVEISKFVLNLNHNGSSLSGTYSVKRGARGLMEGAVQGLVDTTKQSVEFNCSPHGKAYGNYNSTVMRLRWYESGFDQVGGWGDVTLNKQ